MTPEDLELFLGQFDQRIIFISLKILLAIVVAMMFKTVAENIVGYLILRLDQYVGIGTCVETFGKRGKIREISFFTVTIETECGYIRIPTRNWRTSKFIILRDRIELRQRRSTDCEPTDPKRRRKNEET